MNEAFALLAVVSLLTGLVLEAIRTTIDQIFSLIP